MPMHRQFGGQNFLCHLAQGQERPVVVDQGDALMETKTRLPFSVLLSGRIDELPDLLSDRRKRSRIGIENPINLVRDCKFSFLRSAPESANMI
jgi:hypothetical protein